MYDKKSLKKIFIFAKLVIIKKKRFFTFDQLQIYTRTTKIYTLIQLYEAVLIIMLMLEQLAFFVFYIEKNFRPV
ncbi:hypothetical protein AAJ76_100002194 [Vairimorpha ceranae]|uniref:Uncharacterized protein n=1 Tax=Vairimorpha ceranae TaxID=40302 RepID=A0A0F9ZEJ7_9MICR|nr:hypothetical protein AAJ76_100002194 [Vairimorpha ceranae]KKO75854.1 hypothetical protein AAJ76_100002194 [Vairimorpha ceranae]